MCPINRHHGILTGLTNGSALQSADPGYPLYLHSTPATRGGCCGTFGLGSMNTSKRQRVVLLAGFLIAAAINIWGLVFIPGPHLAPYCPIGSEVVRVYEPSADSTLPSVPIQRTATSRGVDPFVDTGKKVPVLIRSDYGDSTVHQRTSLLTLAVMLFGLGAYTWAERGNRTAA